MTDDELLAALKRLLKEKGELFVSSCAGSDDLSTWVQVEVALYLDGEKVLHGEGGC